MCVCVWGGGGGGGGGEVHNYMSYCITCVGVQQTCMKEEEAFVCTLCAKTRLQSACFHSLSGRIPGSDSIYTSSPTRDNFLLSLM